jgi:arsenite-transporting ATPase
MTELWTFTGKGGVGKSTCSSSTAVKFADEGKRVLLVSSDPAHNLSDLFDMKFGNEPTSVPTLPNLFVKEIDALSDAQEFMNSFNVFMKSMLKKASSVDMDLFKDLVFPGIDEVFAMRSMLYDYRSGKWDVIVFDTAPTGHTLRALTTPDMLDAWLLRMLAMRKKFRALKGAFFKKSEDTSFEDFIIPLRKDIQEVKGMLGLPTSHIILVTIPEKLGIMETHRTIKFLRQMNLDAEGVIVNRIVPDFGSEWEVDLNIVKLTRGEFDTHCENLTLAGTLFGSEVNIRQVPKVAYAPIGVERLRQFYPLIWH